MIADSAKRQFQGILVYQLDRFARNRYDSATYKAKQKKNGVKALSARENITNDASGVLMESVLKINCATSELSNSSSMAQLARQTITKNYSHTNQASYIAN